MKARTATVFAGVAVAAAALGVYFATWQTQSKLPFGRPAGESNLAGGGVF